MNEITIACSSAREQPPTSETSRSPALEEVSGTNDDVELIFSSFRKREEGEPRREKGAVKKIPQYTTQVDACKVLHHLNPLTPVNSSRQ
jgi:hypothetical protein